MGGGRGNIIIFVNFDSVTFTIIKETNIMYIERETQ